jgi:putative ABC transport system permease protein
MSMNRWWDETAQDARYALRTLRRQPGFTAAAILTLAFGIGATTAILSVVNGVMVRPLPYPEADRAVLIYQTGRPNTRSFGRDLPFSAANFVDLRRLSGSFRQVAAFRRWNYTLVEGTEAQLLAAARVSPGLFEALGVDPAVGRVFQIADEQPGAEPVVILGDGLWRRQFGGRTDILGRTISLNGIGYTVVGVMPRGFNFPRGAELPSGLNLAARTEIWTPFLMTPGDLQFRGTQNLAVVGLPRPGVELAAVQADLDLTMSRLEEQFPDFNTNMTARAVPLLESAVATVKPALLVLLGAVAFLLIIACVNVSNLLLTRTAARTREVALRTALGAARIRLIRQFVTENLLLTLAGGGLGIFLAILGKDALLAMAPDNLPRVDDIAVDWRVLGTVLAVVLAVGVGFGGLVGAEVIAIDHTEALREGAKGSGGRARRRLRHGLVILEVAVSVVLLSGAGVLGRTFQNLRRVDPGFDPAGVLTARVTLPLNTSDFREFPRLAPGWARFYRQLTEELALRPGIRAAAAATTLPLSGVWESSGFAIAGRPPLAPGESQSALFAGVSDGYFGALGIPLRRGRLFDSRDRDSARTVIISESMAREYWPNEEALGARIQGLFAELEVIGVVGDINLRSISAEPAPTMYLPIAVYPGSSMSLVVAADGRPDGVLPAVRQVLRSIDPAVPLTEIQTMAEVMAESIAQQRFSATLVGTFALAALGLAILGLYGVISFGVARRSREIGVRLALGAEPGRLMGMVVREGVVLSLIGVVIGVVGSVALGRVLSRLVFQVSPTDPVTLGAVSIGLVGVAMVASLIPARRAIRIDPVAALREE